MRLNREFYDGFATQFADSRSALQPGIARALGALGPFDSLIDVGCGDGRVGRALVEGLLERPPARYLGVDFSSRLAERFKAGARWPARYGVAVVDLTAPDWSRGLGRFDAAVCFSVLHHIPGDGRRARLLRQIRALLNPGGRCAVSVWQVTHVDRLRRKIVDWSEAGLRGPDVDPGDYLIDWQRGGRGLRYVHELGESEMMAVCRRAGFNIGQMYRSDGATGDMGLYAILETKG